MHLFRRAPASLLGLAAGAALLCAPAQAQIGRGVLQGQDYRLIIGYTPGGGYDSYARLVARHMGTHIPGKPQIVPRNMPGGGSRTAVANIYNVAPRTAPCSARPTSRSPLAQAMGDKPAVRHDEAHLHRQSERREQHHGDLAHSPVKTIEDAQEDRGADGRDRRQHLLAISRRR